MYQPSVFAQTSQAALAGLMDKHPFGTLVTVDATGPHADHLPFLYEAGDGEAGVLRAHVARANDLCERCASGGPALVVFQGPDAYISPGWYPSKQESHRLVPTWNYEVVHARGTLTLHEDPRFLRGLLARLTRRHEAAEPRPWRMGEAAPGYIDSLLPHIVGIEITLSSLIGKSKLSQNREPRDRLAAADTLQARGHDALAQRMRDAG